jgi:hypothetical protein
MTLETFIGINCVLFLLYVLFYGMTTTVDHERIRISYGIGLIRKSFALSRINTVQVVSNPWYYGWGIRLIPNGWLYNITGYGGVEITFAHTKTIVRFGSAVPTDLRNSIQANLQLLLKRDTQ